MDLEGWGSWNWEWLVKSMDGSEDGRVEPLGAAAGNNLVLSVFTKHILNQNNNQNQ